MSKLKTKTNKPLPPKSFRSPLSKKGKAGYEYLLAYKITIPVYDYTVEFCSRCKFPNFPNYPNLPSHRSHDQMVQAARSGTQNIAEGYKQEGLKGYIKLSGVNRGSLEELLKDFVAYARQNKLAVWSKDKCIREIREIEEIWEIIKKNKTLPDQPNFPDLPDDPEKAVNLMITLINQANYLIDRLIPALKEKHKTEGGLTEKLYSERRKYRGF